MVMMGLSMAKGVQKPKDYHHTLVQTLQRLLTENVIHNGPDGDYINTTMVMMGLSIVETIEIPEELFPHLAILTFKNTFIEEIRSRAEDIVNANDIPYFGDRDADFWRLGNADLIVKHLEQTEDLWDWFREPPDENGYYDLNEVIGKFPWKADAFSDDGERAEKLLKEIISDGELYDLERRWRKEIWHIEHGLILQESAEKALIKLGKMNSEDSVWGGQSMDNDEYVWEELNSMQVSELRESCKMNDLKVSGTKKELMERLYEHLKD